MMFSSSSRPLGDIHETSATLLTGEHLSVSVTRRGSCVRAAVGSVSMSIALYLEPREARALAAELIAAANASDGIAEAA